MTREEAIKELELIAEVTTWNDRRLAANMAIDALHTKLIGEWLPRWGEVECSICGEFEKKKSNFCPTCGAKMVEDSNDK